jgi:hypothetical protein
MFRVPSFDHLVEHSDSELPHYGPYLLILFYVLVYLLMHINTYTRVQIYIYIYNTSSYRTFFHSSSSESIFRGRAQQCEVK